MHSVEVLIPPLTFHLGFIEFPTTSTDLNWLTHDFGSFDFATRFIILFVSIGIGSFIGFSSVRYCIRRQGRRHLKSAQYIASRPNTCSEDDTSANKTRPIQNVYGDWRDRLIRLQLRRESTSTTTPPQIQVATPDADEETMHLLEGENYLILRDHLTLGEVVGQGHFGCVYKGILNIPGKEENKEVAVKTLHNRLSNVELDSKGFLQEGLLMKDFRHQNVLALIGVCFEADGSPMVVIPFMKYGDLHAYISSEDVEPTVEELMIYGKQIAAGMKYLSDQKFVHRDLAARNCMLDENHIVKVADFGLSRDIYERDYYSSSDKKAKLPIRWMAPESLEKATYTTKSDVWSFGVVLWELMTRGVLPYPDVDNWDVLPYLKCGRRMMQPTSCPNLLYAVMLTCWREDSEMRPTFGELEIKIQEIIIKLKLKSKQKTVSTKVTYLNCSPPSPEDTSESTL